MEVELRHNCSGEPDKTALRRWREKLSKQEVAVYLSLRELPDETVGIDRLAKVLGLSKTGTRTILSSLEQQGLVTLSDGFFG